MPPTSPAKPRRSYQRSGVYTLKKAVATLGNRALPTKRTALGRALQEWRAALIADLGGEDAVSTQQLAFVDLAVRTKLLVDSVDAYVLAMPSPVNRQKRSLFPVVRERQMLVGQLQSILRDLGLDRRVKSFDLAAELAALHREAPTPPPVDRPTRRSSQVVDDGEHPGSDEGGGDGRQEGEERGEADD
jgi:hypothetical protein